MNIRKYIIFINSNLFKNLLEIKLIYIKILYKIILYIFL